MEHAKIINKIAKQILKPEGIERKGQSRIWYDDQGWYTLYIEFVPLKYDKGTGLNVAINFHWYKKDYISFDIRFDDPGAVEFESTEQFTTEVTNYCRQALKRVVEYKQLLSNWDTAAENMTSYHFVSDSLWGNYHKGVICGLLGDKERAIHYFNLLMEVDHDFPWEIELKNRTGDLMKLVGDTNLFREHIREIIKETRSLKKLNEAKVLF